MGHMYTCGCRSRYMCSDVVPALAAPTMKKLGQTSEPCRSCPLSCRCEETLCTPPLPVPIVVAIVMIVATLGGFDVVHHRPEHCGPNGLQVAHGLPDGALAGILGVKHEQHPVRLGGDGGRVGDQFGGRDVYEHVIEVSADLFQEVRETPGTQ